MATVHETVDRYLQIWNQRDPAARRAAVRAVFGEACSCTDPLAAVSGHDGIDRFIAGVQPQFAGVHFTLAGGLAPRIRNLPTGARTCGSGGTRRSSTRATTSCPSCWPIRNRRGRWNTPASVRIAIPLVLETPRGVLHLLSTTTVFGTPVEVTLSELAIESFFPADAATLELLGGGAAAPDPGAAQARMPGCRSRSALRESQVATAILLVLSRGYAWHAGCFSSRQGGMQCELSSFLP